MDAISHLKRSEGLRLKAYQDSEGVWTIGYGRNLQALRISQEQAEEWLMEDYRTARYETDTLMKEWGILLDQIRKEVLIEMMFNLGYSRLRKFRLMLSSLADRDYEQAAAQMLDSKWATQVHGRAHRLAAVMRSGSWEDAA